MKLTSSLLVLTIAGGIAPPAEAGQQGLEMDWGQKARPSLVIVQAQRHLEEVCPLLFTNLDLPPSYKPTPKLIKRSYLCLSM